MALSKNTEKQQIKNKGTKSLSKAIKKRDNAEYTKSIKSSLNSLKRRLKGTNPLTSVIDLNILLFSCSFIVGLLVRYPTLYKIQIQILLFMLEKQLNEPKQPITMTMLYRLFDKNNAHHINNNVLALIKKGYIVNCGKLESDNRVSYYSLSSVFIDELLEYYNEVTNSASAD